jgi:hypothetical protein
MRCSTASRGWIARLRGFDALAILADGRVLATPHFPVAA